MTTFHAVLRIDHQTAEILRLDAGQVHSDRVKAHIHHTSRHQSGVRAEHEFYGQVCDALAGIAEVLVVGSSTSQADFRHYVDKPRPAVSGQIVGYEAIDKPTTPQLLAFARQYFARFDRMNLSPGARPA